MIVRVSEEEKMYCGSFPTTWEAKQSGKGIMEAIAWKREKVIACTSRQLKVLMKDCMANVAKMDGGCYLVSLISRPRFHLGKGKNVACLYNGVDKGVVENFAGSQMNNVEISSFDDPI
ncbi:hypothetical protein Tco_0000689 [Tanacetum coccineum]